MANRPTRDLIAKLPLPVDCITATALRGLANALDRLGGFHKSRGGTGVSHPCLTDVSIENGNVVARVISGEHTYKLELVNGDWEFR